MKKILIFGKRGQLAWYLNTMCSFLGEVICIGQNEYDLNIPENACIAIKNIKPDIVLNAAAYTFVDQAENDQNAAFRLNAIAPKVMAETCKLFNIPFIHYSTDYVFDGTGQRPYQESDTPRPVSVYGHSKLAGEQEIQAVGGAFCILRTAWVYSEIGKNFYKFIKQQAKLGQDIFAVTDQVGSPTHAMGLAYVTACMLLQWRNDLDIILKRTGVFHVTALGACSRYEFANQILQLGNETRLAVCHSILTKDHPSAAVARPPYSVLNCQKFQDVWDICLPTWQQMLQQFCASA